jgi:hypothetical protein
LGLPNFSVVGLKASLEVAALGSVRGALRERPPTERGPFSDAVRH